MIPGFETRHFEGAGARIRAAVGGSGPPLLLLHGYPQTHAMWHKIAPRLAADFTVVAANLRGYGGSDKPPTSADHAPYSKRAMAADQVAVMREMGFPRFMVAGHDRGARVAHRMALDHAQAVEKAAVLDIVATHTLYANTDRRFAEGYYHWFFLIQLADLPERMIGADPEYYLRQKLGQWAGVDDAFTEAAMAEYLRYFSDPAVIHASCEDYRAAASIDLVHDEADIERRIGCPFLVLWGEAGLMHRTHDVLATWRDKADDVRGRALPCGHFLAEEAPDETYRELAAFFKAGPV